MLRLLSPGMLGNFALVSVMTLALRGSSFMRDASLAGSLGASVSLDAFVFVWSVIAFLMSILAGGLPQAFVPIYEQTKRDRGELAAQRLGVQALICHFLVLVIVATLLYSIAPFLMAKLGQGLNESGREIANSLFRGLLIFLVAQGLMEFFAVWLHVEQRFTLATIAPAFAPLGTLVAVLFSWGRTDSSLIVLGTVCGGFIGLALVAWAQLTRVPWSRKFHQSCRVLEPGLGTVMQNALPFFLSGAIFSISSVVDTAMATTLGATSVATLGYAEKTCGLILGLTAGPAAAVVLPYFSRAIAGKEWQSLRNQVGGVIGALWMTTLPMVILLYWQAPAIVKVLFGYGAFDTDSCMRVAAVLQISVWQIPFYLSGLVLSRLAVCLQATWLMIGLSAVAVVVNITLNTLFMRTMGLAGISLSTTLVHVFCTIVLMIAVLRIIQRRRKEDLA
jgi:putative peptidoglycan lipid II flippase